MTNDELRKQIGARITELRKEAGMSKTALAEKAGIHRPHLSCIEQGKYGVTIDVIGNIAHALGKRIDFVAD